MKTTITEISLKTNNKLTELEDIKTQWETKKPEKILEELEDEEAFEQTYINNFLSGNKLTKKQANAVNKGEAPENLPFDDYIETHNTYLAWYKLIRKIKTTEIPNNADIFLEIHNNLTNITTPIKAGKYRDFPLRPHQTYKPSTEPQKISEQVNSAFQKYAEKNTNKNNILKIVELQQTLQIIQAFEIGNSKTCRFLQNLHLIQNGYWAISIETEDKIQYQYAIETLKQGNIEIYYNYLLNKLIITGKKNLTKLNEKTTSLTFQTTKNIFELLNPKN
jgi:Fic family protein